MADQPVSARDLLDRGAYSEAAQAFLRVGEYASAARAFVCCKDFHRAAQCYEHAQKPLDAARLFMLTKEWRRAADLYTRAGDSTRAQLALQQHQREMEASQESKRKAAQEAQATLASQTKAPPKPPEEDPFPQGAIWKAMKVGDFEGASQLYIKEGSRSGWILLDEARSPKALAALGETLFLARDYAVAAEAFRKTREDLRAAQCLSLAGLNAEAADLFMRCGQRAMAAQHLEKAHSWEQAAEVYREDHNYLDAARCHERDDDPVKAAALYLKAKRADLALPILQAIPPKHRQFSPCRLLAGKILFQKGQRDLALSFLAPLMDLDARGEDGLETLYQLAVLLDQGGETQKARDLYHRLQEMRFDFKDVTSRLQKMEQALLASPQKAARPPEPVATRSAMAPGAPVAEPAPFRAHEVDLSPLKDCSLFNRLDLEELRRLWGIGKVSDVAAGMVLLGTGQASDGLFIVLSGGLTITPDPANLDLAVGFLGAGDYVGLGCLVQGPPRPNALVAQGQTRLLFLPTKGLEAFLSAEPDLGMRLFRSIAEQLSQTLMAQAKR